MPPKNPPQALIDSINSHSSFLIHAHLNPDADSLGSVFALSLILKKLGKQVLIYCEDRLEDRFFYLPQSDLLEHLTLRQALRKKLSAYICLDTAKWELATREKRMPMLSLPILNIDHHGDNSIDAATSWIDPDASATAIMVYQLLQPLGVQIDADIAHCLLAGILGDTGFFTNTNTTPDIFTLTHDLIIAGADYNQHVLFLTRTSDFTYWKPWQLLIKNMTLSPDGSYVYTTISREEYQNLGYPLEVAPFANSVINSIRGTRFGAILVEKTPGVVKGSLRARLPDVDITPLAHALGGGGHPASCGFRLDLPLEQALDAFHAAASRLKP